MPGCCLPTERCYGSTPRSRSGTSIPAASETPGLSSSVRLASSPSQVARSTTLGPGHLAANYDAWKAAAVRVPVNVGAEPLRTLVPVQINGVAASRAVRDAHGFHRHEAALLLVPDFAR